MPVQPPLQPVKLLPVAGVAVNVTDVPLEKDTLHEDPQLIPDGKLVTVPLPVPNFATDNTNAAAIGVTFMAEEATLSPTPLVAFTEQA